MHEAFGAPPHLVLENEKKKCRMKDMSVGVASMSSSGTVVGDKVYQETKMTATDELLEHNSLFFCFYAKKREKSPANPGRKSGSCMVLMRLWR